jgi:hypothetical protein
LQQILVGARWDTVDSVVSAHDATDIHVSDAGLERLQIILAQVLLGRVVVLAISVRFDVIHSVVLAGSYDLFVFESIDSTLETGYQVGDVALGMESVFGRYFQSSAPSRVKESVDLIEGKI